MADVQMAPQVNHPSIGDGLDTQARNQEEMEKIVSDLGRRLSTRIDKVELESRGIWRDPEGSPQREKDKESAREKLAAKIGQRPSKVDLKLRNILRVESSDSLTGSSSHLEKASSIAERSQHIKSCLKKRPDRSELMARNIMKGGDLASSATKQQEADCPTRSDLVASLDAKIRSRPAPDDPDIQKVIFCETVEVMPTFRKSEYSRKPDPTATFRKLTPQLKVSIREELNAFKKTEMVVHEESLRNTCFH
ncbi:hypothetical protein M427DRAFT_490234 [Gonapodya prolifera JEL478]|uniref:Uncharacterized protein n=1 Tax=Gonapodya prolifera (strain JEL478) TaxID=1344416 RepID=A0A139AP22_GONPJ|nr:hypothetical protein M427DRAFT_490234 [Gonapodya prolifera JEL478]|eukprot:KXS18253.1 hypothetical protein M427DRAFT_490234 [Gonapodya prolifera JEL478]